MRLTLAALVSPDDIAEELLARLRARASASCASAPLPLLDPAPAGRFQVASAMPPEHYEAAVARAVELIRAGRLEKIVLAREVQVHAPARATTRPRCSACCARSSRRASCFCVGRGDADADRRQPRAAGAPRGPRASARWRSPARPGAAPTRPSTTISASSCCATRATARSMRSSPGGSSARCARTRCGSPRRPSPSSCGSPTSSTSRRRSARSWPRPIGRARAGRADAPDARRRRRAAGARRAADPRAGGPRPRLVRRARWAGPTPTGDGEFCVALRCALLRGAGRALLCRRRRSCATPIRPAELAETEVKLAALLPAAQR